MANIGGGRIVRVCDLCGGVDDHPRHVIAGNQADLFTAPDGAIIQLVLSNAKDLPVDDQNRLLNELVDTSSSDRHLDCCAAAGCPTGTCEPQVAGAKGKTGKALLNHIVALADPFADNPAVVRGVAEPVGGSS